MVLKDKMICQKVTYYGQVVHTSAMTNGEDVRNMYKNCYRQLEHTTAMHSGEIGSLISLIPLMFNNVFNQHSTVIDSWRESLVVFETLRIITCYKCHKENFYIEIKTSIQAEFFFLLDGKFVCPKCGGKN